MKHVFLWLVVCLGFSCSNHAYAQSGTVTFSGVNVTAQNNSCAALRTGYTVGTILGCTTDPVTIGSQILYTTAAVGTTARAATVGVVSSVGTTGPNPVAGLTQPMMPGIGNAYVSPSAAPSGATNIAVTVKDAFGTATADQYLALATLFGLFMAALVLIWAKKFIVRLLFNPPEH